MCGLILISLCLNMCSAYVGAVLCNLEVRRYLTADVSVLVANAIVSSRLDYCNSLFRSLSKLNLRKLQCIQNSAARIVTNTSKFSRITPVLKKLHWLPVEYRTVFKTAILVYKFLHSGIPQYFDTYLQSYKCGYNTRHCQNEGKYLAVPRFQPSVHKSAKHFTSSFSFNSPALWNELPYEVHASPTTVIFRRKLKAYLLNKAYPP